MQSLQYKSITNPSAHQRMSVLSACVAGPHSLPIAVLVSCMSSSSAASGSAICRQQALCVLLPGMLAVTRRSEGLIILCIHLCPSQDPKVPEQEQ